MPLNDTIRVRVSKALKDSLQEMADAEHRSLSNLAKIALEQYLRNHRTAATTLNERADLKYIHPHHKRDTTHK